MIFVGITKVTTNTQSMNISKKFILVSLLFTISIILYGQRNRGGELPNDLSYSGEGLEILNHKAQWDTLKTFPLYANYDVSSIVTNGVNFYSTTWDTNWFFKHDMEGVILKAFQIPGVKHVRDLTFSHITGYFYGSNADDEDDVPCEIFEMNFYQEVLVRTIPVHCAGINHVRHITYDVGLDNGRGGFWIGDWSSLGAVDMQGNQLIGANQITGKLADCFGSAYDRTSDFFNPKLWLSCNLYPTQDSAAVQILRSFDINTLTLSDVIYEIDGTGFPNWLPNDMFSGGIFSYRENGYLYLAHAFQTRKYDDLDMVVIFELAKEGLKENTKQNRNIPKIIPNPVADQCNIYLHGFNAKQVSIYDMTGKLILKQDIAKDTDNEKITIDVSSLSAGVYHLYLDAGIEKHSLKMLVP